MATVYKERGKWTASWYDSKGKRHYTRGLASKQFAQEIGIRREAVKTLAKHGIVDPDRERHSRESERPVEEHLSDYSDWLRTQGRTPKHIHETVGMIRRVFEYKGINRIDQIDRDKVEVAAASIAPRKSVPGDKLSHRSRNKALAAVRAFGYWLACVSRRIPAAPITRVRGWDVQQDRRRKRVILSEQQVLNLIETTATQPTRGGMTGMDRMMRYAIGIGTGFRQGTLFSLTPESFRLDGEDPEIRVEATNIKSRKAINHPIGSELAELIRPWLATKEPKKPVFPKLPHSKPIIAYRHDLAAAGIRYHEEDTILYCDQHAQRGTFITSVIRTAGLKVAQDLAHHSTPVLTSQYGQMDIRDYSKALAGLPKMKRRGPNAERKTG